MHRSVPLWFTVLAGVGALSACGRTDLAAAETDFGTESLGEEEEGGEEEAGEEEGGEEEGGTTGPDLPPPGVCGDGVVDPDEDCDRGRNNGGDGWDCTEDCSFDECGNGQRGSQEACDDGPANGTPASDCTEACSNNFCGDGFVAGGEACDLGPANGPNSDCTFICTRARCGDGLIGPGEQCDDGNDIDDDGCTNDCRLENCGDGIVQSGEQCDDGNDIDDDGCTNDCRLPACGDGIVQAGEECDDGNAIDDDDCTNACTLPVCGDGIVQEGEECDDGNDIDDDGCSNACILPVCGDGIVQAGEECDDGNAIDDDDCTNACTLPVCGDGIVQDGEACDDGDTADGNGCNNDCRPSAEVIFEEVLGGPGGDQAFDVAVDSLGNAVVVGRVRVDAPFVHNEAWIRKYAPNGDVLWTQTFWGGEGNDYGYGVAVDGADNIILGGRVSRTASGGDLLVIKYDPDGAVIWTDEWAAPAGSTDKVNDVAVDGAGNIYVAGDTWNTGQAANVLVRKYSAAGAVQWTRSYNGANGNDIGHGVTVDSAGRILVAGEAWASASAANIWLRRYDDAGGALGTSVIDFAASNDRAFGIDALAGGGYVVAGTIWTPGQSQNTWVRRYSASDAIVWTRTFNGPASSEDIFQDVVEGPDGSITAVGWYYVGSGRNGYIRKYDANGNTLWGRVVAGADGLNDYLRGVAVDAEGNLWVVGEVTSATDDRQIYVRKMRP